MALKTPLYKKHVAAGAKMVPFGGYDMPVQYSGIIAEHKAVRGAVGLFDVSHMGELRIAGADAMDTVQHLITRDVSRLPVDSAAYSPMCNEMGGVVDDVLVYRLAQEEFMLCVNASNRFKDAAWAEANLIGFPEFADVSDEFGQLALQGPMAEAVALKLTDACNIPEKNYTFKQNVPFAGHTVLLSRTGYTGEDGFEVYCASADTCDIWDKLLEAGAEFGILPCGLGARDTLRMEAAMPLYGHEMDDDVMPYEAGIGFFVNTDKAEFIGREALIERKDEARKRVGLELIDRGIAREGALVFKDGMQIGLVTSGTFSPTLGRPIAMARLPKAYAEEGAQVEIEIHDKMCKASVIKLPFYKRQR